MAGIVYVSDVEKFSFPEAESALVSDGHLVVYTRGAQRPSEILATFAPGKWARFIRDGHAVQTTNGRDKALTVSVAP